MGTRFALNVSRTWKSFSAHPIVVLSDVVKWKLVSFRLVVVLISMQNRCIVCTKCIIDPEIALGTPKSTRR
jgi:hypothetical protein